MQSDFDGDRVNVSGHTFYPKCFYRTENEIPVFDESLIHNQPFVFRKDINLQLTNTKLRIPMILSVVELSHDMRFTAIARLSGTYVNKQPNEGIRELKARG